MSEKYSRDSIKTVVHLQQPSSRKSLCDFAQIAFLASFLALAGCASSMSKQDCQTKDLYSVGLADGQDGKGNRHFQDLQAQCEKQGVNLTDDKYNYGHEVGLAQYCTNDLAKDDARSGKTDSICMQSKVPPYITAYNAALHNLKSKREEDLKDVESNQARLQKREDQLKGQVNKIDEQQKNDSLK